jgi:hypothetical protein
LDQLFDFALQRELDSATGELDTTPPAVQATKDGIAFLATSPFGCREVGAVLLSVHSSFRLAARAVSRCLRLWTARPSSLALFGINSRMITTEGQVQPLA